MLEKGIADWQEVVEADGLPFSKTGLDPEAVDAVLAEFDTYHPMAVESLGQVALLSPSETQ